MTALIVIAALSFGALIGFVAGIHLVMRDIHRTAYHWRVAALAEPLYGETLTACADEIEHLQRVSAR
jgi:uncharacterized membrane protein